MFRSKKCSKKTFVQIGVVVLGLTATHSLVESFPSMLSPVVAQSNSQSPSFPLPKSLPSGTILKADGSGSMRVINEPLRKRSEEKFPGTKAQSNNPSPSFPLPKSLPSGTTVKVDGSNSMRVINEPLRKGFEEKFPGTKVEAASGGTDGSLAALLRGDIDMAAVGRPLTDKEKAQGLVAIPVNREKIAIIVGSDNPFKIKKNLTLVEFAKMFRGEITDWSQLGGAPGKIRFIDHPEWGDTRRALGTYDIFKKGRFKNGANTTRLSQDDTATIVQALGKNGISYAIADQVLNLPNVRVIPLHKILPSNPRYSYSQPQSYVYRQETVTPGMLAFLGFATAAPGQEILASAKQQEAEAVGQFPKSLPSGTTVKVDGSSSMRVINEALRKGFEEKFPGTKVELASGGTDGALAALLRGDINMAAVGRPLTDKEKAQGLVAIPVSREKIAIIVGSDNPFKIKKNLTFVEFAKMFRGEITNWSQLGGAPGKIRFIDHPEWGDTRRALGTYDIFKKGPFKNGANTTRLSQDDTATIVQALGKNGISYAIADQVLNLPNVRVIPLHKILPSNPRYSYSQPQSYVYRQETVTPGMLAFLGFATSASGQEILAAAKQQEAEAVGQFPKSLPSGTTVKVDGSSSMRVINEALRKGFEEKFPGTKVELASGGTDGALAALLRGDINMAAVGRPLTDKEKAQGLVAIPVSREKIAIIVGSDNPFKIKKNLTFVEFAKMFRGEITNWSQLGGAPGKIRFIDHPEWGDTRRALGTYDIFKKGPFKNGANTTRLSQDDTASIVQALGKNGISYAIADQVLNLPNVRVIPLHKTLPSNPRYSYSQRSEERFS